MLKIWLNIMLFSFLQSLVACGQQTYDQKLQSLYSNTVPLVKPQEVKEKLNSKEVVILDTRSAKEYSISHLPDAQFVGYDHFDIEQVKDIPKDKEVVVYCSVGYRSEKIGEKLKNAGFQNVSNMYGGIFQWKNEDFEVVNQKGQITDSVHVYNKRWGKWLEEGKGIKVYE
ncbi:rhodanese-like domain-containing protein [Marivirga salinae]|uniref:Rhodanese-like domain-containing protein n=1 Tax=Marivirga salinarum TaxID=3059078 RepID=A0AA51RC22_9BACT|nr:rhodanese-like domain-containing protein [Marivirga sp. BDSF4-3]WMN12946.1 rhodanese-like domain-containing protein [Marivirga sp. BDSF4-3]